MEPARSENSRQASRGASGGHPDLGMEARSHCAVGRRIVGACNGAIQCVAGAVPDVSGDGLADRRRRRREVARRAGGGDVGLVVRPRLLRVRIVLDRLRLPGRCIDLRVAVAVRDIGTARLSGVIHGVRLRAGAPALDPRRLPRDRARYQPHGRRMAARPGAHGLSVECIRLRTVGAAGAGADGVADRSVGHDVPDRGDFRKPRRTDRSRLARTSAMDRAGHIHRHADRDGHLRHHPAVAASDLDGCQRQAADHATQSATG